MFCPIKKKKNLKKNIKNYEEEKNSKWKDLWDFWSTSFIDLTLFMEFYLGNLHSTWTR